MREKLQRFMTGRYGADELGRTLNIVVLVSLVVSMFSGLLPVLSVFYWFGIALMIYNCFRMFSKNVSKRYEENQRYLSRRYKAVVKRDEWKKRFAQRDTYRFFKCPGCRQRVRVPKGRGKICITCPKCRREFRTWNVRLHKYQSEDHDRGEPEGISGILLRTVPETQIQLWCKRTDAAQL